MGTTSGYRVRTELKWMVQGITLKAIKYVYITALCILYNYCISVKHRNIFVKTRCDFVPDQTKTFSFKAFNTNPGASPFRGRPIQTDFSYFSTEAD